MPRFPAHSRGLCQVTTFLQLYLTSQPFHVIFLSLISQGWKAQSLIPLCFVFKILVYLSSSARLGGSLSMEDVAFRICTYSFWHLKQCRRSENKFNRIFLSRGMELGPNESCIKYPHTGIHGIPHFILHRMEFSPFWLH